MLLGSRKPAAKVLPSQPELRDAKTLEGLELNAEGDLHDRWPLVAWAGRHARGHLGY
jgi:hypothetical protein